MPAASEKLQPAARAVPCTEPGGGCAAGVIRNDETGGTAPIPGYPHGVGSRDCQAVVRDGCGTAAAAKTAGSVPGTDGFFGTGRQFADAETATQWLPEETGVAMAYGLSEETAFKALTINAAKVIKLDHRIGSLEAGKDADLAIFDGHPLSNMTRCKATMIDGKFWYNELNK